MTVRLLTSLAPFVKAAWCLAADTVVFDLCTLPFGLTMMASPSARLAIRADFVGVCAMAVPASASTTPAAAMTAALEACIRVLSRAPMVCDVLRAHPWSFCAPGLQADSARTYPKQRHAANIQIGKKRVSWSNKRERLVTLPLA